MASLGKRKQYESIISTEISQVNKIILDLNLLSFKLIKLKKFRK